MREVGFWEASWGKWREEGRELSGQGKAPVQETNQLPLAKVER